MCVCVRVRVRVHVHVCVCACACVYMGKSKKRIQLESQPSPVPRPYPGEECMGPGYRARVTQHHSDGWKPLNQSPLHLQSHSYPLPSLTRDSRQLWRV